LKRARNGTEMFQKTGVKAPLISDWACVERGQVTRNRIVLDPGYRSIKCCLYGRKEKRKLLPRLLYEVVC